MKLSRKHLAIAVAAATIFGPVPLLSHAAGVDQNGTPCPDAATVGAGKDPGNSAGNPASEQGVEHSAILPDAGGENSAAPTVKKDGQEVTDTGCPKPPNQLKGPAKAQ